MSEEITEIVDQIEELEIVDLRLLMKAIKELIDGKETPTDVKIGDGVEFELRDGFLVKGTVVDMTGKRAKVKVNAAEGNYTIDLKKVKVTFSAPEAEEEEEFTQTEAQEEDSLLRNEPDQYHMG